MLKLLSFFSFLLIAISQYNKTLAFEYAKLSKMAHASRQEIQTISCQQCPNNIEKTIFVSDKENNIQGFVAYSKQSGTIVVSLRGPLKYYQKHKENLKFTKIQYDGILCPNCKVHEGFAKRANLLYEQIQVGIINLMDVYGKVEIMMTGHSLGGALSTIIGLQLIRKHNYTVSIYTFGSPRVGNAEFAELCSKSFKNSFRIVNKKDTIPHLMPLSLGYTHINSQIWYKIPNKYHQCSNDQVSQCSNSVPLMLLNIADHRIDNYIALFRSQMKSKTALKASSPYTDEIQGLKGYQLLAILRKQLNLTQISQQAN